MCKRVCMFLCMHVYLCMYLSEMRSLEYLFGSVGSLQNKCVRIYVSQYNTCWAQLDLCKGKAECVMYVYLYVCMYACMCVCMYAHLSSVRSLQNKGVRMYVSEYACMYVCTQTAHTHRLLLKFGDRQYMGDKSLILRFVKRTKERCDATISQKKEDKQVISI
jgi:hypothetical protein